MASVFDPVTIQGNPNIDALMPTPGDTRRELQLGTISPYSLDNQRLSNNTQNPTLNAYTQNPVREELYAKYDITPVGRVTSTTDKTLAGAQMLGSALQAASNVTPTTSAGNAAFQAGSAALQSGVAGAIAGSVVPGVGTAAGAIAGTVVGGILGTVNAYLNVSESRKQKREYEKLRASALARADAEKKQQMAIDAEGVRYNRAVAANQARVDRYNSVKSSIVDVMNSDQGLRDRFLKYGYT